MAGILGPVMFGALLEMDNAEMIVLFVFGISMAVAGVIGLLFRETKSN